MDKYQEKLIRLQETLSFREPDRVPLFDLFWQEFIDRWVKEKGLESGTNIYEYYDMDLVLCNT